MSSYKHKFMVVGAGPFGCTFANLASRKGHSVLIVDRRDRVGGNCATEDISKTLGATNGEVYGHLYGPHIFHTSDERVWRFVNAYGDFNNFVNRPKAYTQHFGVLPMPINIATVRALGKECDADKVYTPLDMLKYLNKVTYSWRAICNPEYYNNAEGYLLSTIGPTLYCELFGDYCKKQWGLEPKFIPAEIVKRVPIRFNYNDNYFSDRFQGVPVKGYTNLFENMLNEWWHFDSYGKVNAMMGYEYAGNKAAINSKSEYVIYTGSIDEFFDFCFGPLEYRSLTFEHKMFESIDYQGNAVFNHCSPVDPYTRTTEHAHFYPGTNVKRTMVTFETSHKAIRSARKFKPSEAEDVLAYPVPWLNRSIRRYDRYIKLAANYPNIIFAGRLGSYKYINMDQAIRSAMDLFESKKWNGD